MAAAILAIFSVAAIVLAVLALRFCGNSANHVAIMVDVRTSPLEPTRLFREELEA